MNVRRSIGSLLAAFLAAMVWLGSPARAASSVHVITEFPLFSGSEPLAITAGPDGNLWFTKLQTSKICRLSLSGHVKNYATITKDSPRAWV